MSELTVKSVLRKVTVAYPTTNLFTAASWWRCSDLFGNFEAKPEESEPPKKKVVEPPPKKYQHQLLTKSKPQQKTEAPKR